MGMTEHEKQDDNQRFHTAKAHSESKKSSQVTKRSTERDADGEGSSPLLSQPQQQRPHPVQPRRTLRESSSPRKKEEVRLAGMVGSLLYNIPSGGVDASTEVASEQQPATPNPVDEAAERRRRETQAKLLQSVVYLIGNEIPEDTDELRQSRWYKSTRKLVEFQRDQYLVGKDYATMASEQRYKQQTVKSDSSKPNKAPHRQVQRNTSLTPRSTLSSLANLLPQPEKTAPPFPSVKLPYDPTALGHAHLSQVVSTKLIPLPALYRHVALPWACKVPDLIYQPAENALVRAILGQQSTLHRVLKSRILTFLDNPRNRTAIKTSTRGFILSSSSSSSPAFRPPTNDENNHNSPTPESH
ncbi:hypothetical protein ACA910_002382 [Epithemia clementina (nom. ined.)]